MKKIDGRYVVSLVFPDEQSALEFERYVFQPTTTMMPVPEALIVDPGRVIGHPGDTHTNVSTGNVYGTLIQSHGDVNGDVIIPPR